MTDTTAPGPETTHSGVSRKAVVDAALKCFRQLGPHKTSMSDIAREAGISRKTLYRMFEDRPALVNQVLFQLLRGMGSKSAGAVAKYSDVKEALIEGSIENIRIAQEEELFQAIILNETSTQMEHFLVQGNDAVRAEIVKIWAPVFERGRAEGTLRNDLSDERPAEIIQNVHSLVLMRKDETESAQRAFLEDLLWAALTNQSGS